MGRKYSSAPHNNIVRSTSEIWFCSMSSYVLTDKTVHDAVLYKALMSFVTATCNLRAIIDTCMLRNGEPVHKQA